MYESRGRHAKVDGVKFGMHRQGPLMDHEVGVFVVFGGNFRKRLELLMAEIRRSPVGFRQISPLFFRVSYTIQTVVGNGISAINRSKEIYSILLLVFMA